MTTPTLDQPETYEEEDTYEDDRTVHVYRSSWPAAMVMIVMMICITIGFSVAMVTGVFTHENTLSPKERVEYAKSHYPTYRNYR